jgi:hypothetical protein
MRADQAWSRGCDITSIDLSNMIMLIAFTVAMAAHAAELLDGTGWLPAMLRAA